MTMVMVVNATTDWPWLTMVDYGQSLSVGHGQFMVNDGRVRLLTMVKPWSIMVFTGSLTMKWPSFDHGHYIVMVVNATTDWP